MSARGSHSSLWNPAIVRQAVVDAFWKLDPRVQFRNPVMCLVEAGSALTTVDLRAGADRRHRRSALHRPAGRLAVVHGAVRQPRRGDGRRPRQGAGGDASPGARRDDGAPARRWHGNADRRVRSARGRPRPRRRRRADPRRRRDRRGRRQRRRIGDHRRIGAGDPRGRRRSIGGHRRHARPVGLDHGARHLESGRDLPRPDDRARRRGPAPEDAERDRAEHPARGPDADLPARRRHPAAVRAVRRHDGADPGARRAARLPDADHDRRPRLGDRHRRDGSAGAAQRAGDVGPRRRGRRRRRYPAPRQDRHDHARQPGGHRVHPGAGRHRGRARRRGPARLARRRDARRTIDRRPRQELRAARTRPLRPPRDARAVLGPHADVGHHHRRTRHPQGRGGGDRAPRRRGRAGLPGAAAGGDRSDRAQRRHAAGRGRAVPAPAASSTSRMSSRGACASGSRRCARWASAP